MQSANFPSLNRAMFCAALVATLLSSACGQSSGTRSDWTPAEVHAAIKAVNPDYEDNAVFQIEFGQVVVAQLSGAKITDISPLAGMSLRALDMRGVQTTDISALKGQPLTELYLEDTPVSDIEPLRGTKLTKLYLSNTKVSDLGPLSESSLVELNLLGTGVTDLTPLKGLPIQMLWLNDTPVSDLTPIRSCPLMSVTLHRTQVVDLTPIGISRTIQRLHIGETPVTDLTPIGDLQLSRLIFTPSNITKGIEIPRQIPTMTEIGPTFENRMPPPEFWARFDRGEFQ